MTDADMFAAGFVLFNDSAGRRRYVREVSPGLVAEVTVSGGEATAAAVRYAPPPKPGDSYGDGVTVRTQPVRSAADLTAFVDSLEAKS